MTPSGGHGIQLDDGSGRMIVPLYAQSTPPALSGQGLCISGDHGKTWSASGRVEGDGAEYDGPYEGEVVQLFEKTAAGAPRLLYDCRIKLHPGRSCGGGVSDANLSRARRSNVKGVANCRMTYSSDDLGETWTRGTLHPEMVSTT